jgi:ABC-type multidrug transport system ATPase subunit
VISIKQLSKQFGSIKALRELDLSTRPGEVLALLGPNGAGKSTTIKSIVGLVHPDAGTITIDGIDVAREPRRARALIGYLPQRVHFYENLSPREVLAFFAKLRKTTPSQIDPLLRKVGLFDVADRRTAGFSGGMLQRLGLAVALLGDPKLLVLDEPTAGLDPEGSRLFKEIIRERQAAGSTILLSSHLLGEVESISDRIAVCNQGRIVALDTLESLRHSLDMPTRMTLKIAREEVPSSDHSLERISLEAGARLVDYHNGILKVVIDDRNKAAMVRNLEARGARIEDFRTEEATLEDIFMAIVARERPAGKE